MSRPVHILDATKPLSEAICEVVLARSGGSFALGRTMIVVPAGRLARAIERALLRRSREAGVAAGANASQAGSGIDSCVLEAPTIVTPLMLAGRLFEPSLPSLSKVGCEASWREAFEELERRDAGAARAVGAAFGCPREVPRRVRGRIAARLARLSAELATGLQSVESIRTELERGVERGDFDARLSQHWDAIARIAAVRAELLDRAGVVDRDEALAEAVRRARDESRRTRSVGASDRGGAELQRTGEGTVAAIARTLEPTGARNSSPGTAIGTSLLFDRVFVLLADPEPVHRAMLSVLESRGVSVEIFVHADGAASDPSAGGGGRARGRARATGAASDMHEGNPAASGRADDGACRALDDDGFPLPARWADRVLSVASVPDSAIRVGESPEDAAREVVELLRALPAPRRSDAIAVLAPDDETRRAVERALGEVGLPVARAEARPFAATRLGTLLARLEALLSEGSVEALAAFVRHPDVMAWFDRGSSATDTERAVRAASREKDLGAYRAETLARSWRAPVVEAQGSQGYRGIRKRVEELVAPLAGERALCEWPRVLRATLASIVGEDSPCSDGGERVASIARLDRSLRAFAEVPQAFATRYEAHEAIARLRAELDGEEIRGDATHDGVTLLRWLDIGIADEPHLVLAGFHDGAVPEGEVADQLLPDALRRSLGLLSSHRRAARDAWILDGLVTRALARRRAGLPASIAFVTSRRSTTGDPLLPSRFLLRVERDAQPSRVVRLFPADREPRPVAQEPSGCAAFPLKPAVEGSDFDRISVTAFSTYLKCPYLFQLQNDPRLRLRAIDEAAGELDARAFGVLLHAALERWGSAESKRALPTTDAVEIERELSEHLDAHVEASFPRSCAPAVRVQVEIARRRLRRFAQVQAVEAAAGWRVRFVELSFDLDTGPLIKPLQPVETARGSARTGLTLIGRIDRVDHNPSTGEWRALDYKTSSKAEPPEKVHLVGTARKDGPPREWRDLQLPLYSLLLSNIGRRHPLLAGEGSGGGIEVGPAGLGYIHLAPNDQKTGLAMLSCSDQEFEGAFETARRVVGGILAGNFEPAERTPIGVDDPLAPIWGLGLRAASSGEESGVGSSDGASASSEGGDE